MKCPRCGAQHPQHAMVCDCGYDFLSPTWQMARNDPSAFSVQRLGVSHRSRAWSINVSGESLVLSGPGEEERLAVPRPTGGDPAPEATASLSGSVLSVKASGSTYQFRLSDGALSDVRSWLSTPLPARPSASVPGGLGRELRKWGIGLIVLGIAHFALAEFLNPVWGAVIIVLGIANLTIRHAAMFVVNGLSLLLVGVLNIAAGQMGGWSFFGAMQLYWGVKEIRKYGKYAQAQDETKAPAHVQATVGAVTVETT